MPFGPISHQKLVLELIRNSCRFRWTTVQRKTIPGRVCATPYMKSAHLDHCFQPGKYLLQVSGQW